MTRKQPIRRMHRPKSSHVINNQATPQTNPYQTNQETNKEPSYTLRKSATKKVIVNPYEYKNDAMKYDQKPKDTSYRDNVYKATKRVNRKPTDAPRNIRYPDLHSDPSAKLPSIVVNSKRPQKVNSNSQKETYPRTISERNSTPPRLSKISTRQVTDSQEEASHHLPAGRGSLEAAVAAGAAGYNAQSYNEPQRLSFQIHGQEGPHSYRFGHDTGVGYNRQFRYEERDNAGVVNGRYGYYDQAGKLQIVNYSADPHGGFHAEGEHVPKPEYRR